MKSIGKLLVIGIGLTFFCMSSYAVKSERPKEKRIIFPRGVSVNVGQVGWMGGSSLEETDGPWRAGIRRNFDVRDYKPIVEVGEALGMRFMTLFILGELDRLNILREYPTSNPHGANWDNREYIGPTQIEIMDYVKASAANMEFGLTGVLHEFWEDGVKSRAEWFNVEQQEPRDEKIVRRNVELLRRLMAQYDISSDYGHSFPESFISYGFYYNPGADYSLGRVLSENGVKYANTPFATIRGLDHPPLLDGGIDNGVLLLDRFNHGNLWYEYATPPKLGPDSIKTVVVESHWANWLAYDDHLQQELTNRWIAYLKNIQAHPDHYLAKNTEQLYSQWLYKKFTKVEERQVGLVTIDNRSMLDEVYTYDLLGNMVLAVKLEEGEHVASASINGKSISAYYEAEGYGYIYLPKLEQEVYNVKYAIGDQRIDKVVYNSGTYNVYAIDARADSLAIDLKMYGEQIIEIYGNNPLSVSSTNEHLTIQDISYDQKEKLSRITVRGRNMQGERGVINLKF